MKRRYRVQTFDEQTGEPGWCGVVDADSTADATQEGQRQGAMHVGHPQVRVTLVEELSREAHEVSVFGESTPRRAVAA